MSNGYFRKQSWSLFNYRGETYDLTHLNNDEFDVTDSRRMKRDIAVGFSEHCFTQIAKAGDDRRLFYYADHSAFRHFCIERYRLSLGLRKHLADAVQGQVWNLGNDKYASIPTVLLHGNKAGYIIVFSLDRAPKHLPLDLDMRVITAYPCDPGGIRTYGEVRFGRLVSLRMEN